ncbi:MAG: hypothetical protein ABH863_02870 [Candidatus Micrarchaeota archaeon]
MLKLNQSISDEQLKAMILHKLARKRKWSHSHASFDLVVKGIPPHLGRRAKEATNLLVKEGLILLKPTAYGEEISLNSERAEEILARIRRYFEN